MKTLLVACVAAAALSASTTTTWEMNSWSDYIHGRFSGVALDRDGRLTLAPGMIPILQPGQAAVWSLARSADGSIYAGTGNRGRLYRITPDGKSRVIWTADQPEIFAVAVAANGDVIAATSPDGRVYRIGADGKAAELFNPKAKYIWSLAPARDGSLYVGTGAPANVYRVDSSGHAELWYQSGQGHVTSLAIDPEGRVLAGTEPNGILYRIPSRGKAFVLYNANLPEIRAISVAGDGAIYAAAMGGSLAARGNAQVPVSMTPMSVSVTATSTTVSETDSGTDTQGGSELKVTPATKQPAPQAVQTVMPSSPTVDVTGVEKSALYRVNPDNTVETLWSSKDENIYDIAAPADGDLLMTTDDQGRIYRLSPNRKAALIAQTGEGEATRLLLDGSNVLAATAETGRVVELTKAPAAGGHYESPVHDCGAVARWGVVTWRQTGAGTVSIDTRAGNSARPDNTWSDWKPVEGDSHGARLVSPNARYVQWRASLKGASPGMENVIVAYLPQNSPPVVRSINVTTLATQNASSKAASAASSSQNAAYTVTVTDTGDTSTATSPGTPTQTLSRAGGSQIQVSWQADDPDNDRLVYSLFFRPEDEQNWMLIRSNMTENTLLLDGDILANGRYLFRVVASDRPSNPPEAARESDLVSSPVLIDNTPPAVAITTAHRAGAVADLEVDARDGESALRRCEYSVDAAPWLPVEAVDGLTDSPHEQFRIHVDHLSPGEHLIVVRVYDSAGNAGLAKYVAPGE